MNDTPIPCHGKSQLFDSVESADHRAAARLCATCPMLDACRQHAAQVRDSSLSVFGYSMAGTWAGRLYGRPGVNTVVLQRLEAEDAAYDDEQARACSVAWHHGDRSDYVKVGRRVYERRTRRLREARKAVA